MLYTRLVVLLKAPVVSVLDNEFGKIVTFPSSQNGPALSKTPLAKNQVGFITVGPNAVNACGPSFENFIRNVIRLSSIYLGV